MKKMCKGVNTYEYESIVNQLQHVLYISCVYIFPFIYSCYHRCCMEIFSLSHLALWTLNIRRIQEDSSVDQRPVNVSHHGAHVASPVRRAAILQHGPLARGLITSTGIDYKHLHSNTFYIPVPWAQTCCKTSDFSLLD